MNFSTSPNSAPNSLPSLSALSSPLLSALRTQTSAEKLSRDLRAFVREAWPILEPVPEMSWNWHLDLVCEYLTLIKENRFKQICGAEWEAGKGGPEQEPCGHRRCRAEVVSR